MDSTVVAVAIIVAVGMVVAISAWQIFATGKAAVSADGKDDLKRLATSSAEAMQQAATQLEQTNVELSEVKGRLAELERLLKEVG